MKLTAVALMLALAASTANATECKVEEDTNNGGTPSVVDCESCDPSVSEPSGPVTVTTTVACSKPDDGLTLPIKMIPYLAIVLVVLLL